MSRPLLDSLSPIILILLLLLGIVFEWINWRWLALTINAGFFALFGFAILGKAVITLVTNSPPYNSELSMAVGIIGIPCTAVAAVDFYLYWASGASHRNSSDIS